MAAPAQSFEQRSLSVVTAVYNGEASLAELCRRLHEVLPRVATEHEIILVNDGSIDRSWDVISELSSRSPTARPLSFPPESGGPLRPEQREFL
jgi:glycosyltransferase involved in cell wall biosynthesis